MDYKKIIKKRKTRLYILYKLSWLPDNIMLRLQYRLKMGFWPNFKNPKRYTEIMQLYKMRYRNPIMSQCVDKYEVRNYVKGKGLGQILIPLYGVYKKPEEIDYNLLPNQFIAKSTAGGGGLNVLIVKDKKTLDETRFKAIVRAWCWKREKTDIETNGREWAYSGIKQSRIIIEELLEEDTNEDKSVEDYKFLCFNGKFACMWVDRDRRTDHKRGFWDKDFNYLPHVSCEYPPLDKPFLLPSNIKKMAEIAEKLSEDFPHARIDLYNVKGKIYFGEITFYFSSGFATFTPDEYDFYLGSLFKTSFLGGKG